MFAPRLIPLIVLLCWATPPLAQNPIVAAQPAPEANLADFLWVSRPLVIFADSEADPRFRQQMTMLDQNPEDLTARDVVILTDTDSTTLSPLRRQLRPRDFMLVLIDKDGTVIQRRPTPTPVRDLSSTIDRLPSRQLEVGSPRR